MGTQGASSHGKDNGGQGQMPVDQSLADKTKGGQGGAAGRGELVGGNGIVDGHACQQVGRQGNQSAASANGIHQSCQKQQRAYNEKGMNGQCHSFASGNITRISYHICAKSKEIIKTKPLCSQ